MQNIEAARLRQQAAIDTAAQKYREEKAKKDELLAQQRQEEWKLHEQGLGYKSKTKKTTDDDLSALGLGRKNLNPTSKPRIKDDYNPLTGQSTSGASCERPTFRRAQPRQGG